MNRNNHILRIFFAGLLGAAAPVAQLHAAEADKNLPNILFIMADDMGYSDIGCYGGEIATPNIDKLANEGMRFRQFYNDAKCGPSRSALLTGQYSHQGGFRVGATFAEVLRSVGYQTWMAGKWHNTPKPTDYGFDRYYGLVDGCCNFWNPGLEARTGEGKPGPGAYGDHKEDQLFGYPGRTWAVGEFTFSKDRNGPKAVFRLLGENGEEMETVVLEANG